MTGTPGAPTRVIVGLDVGTTSTKAVAFGLGVPWRHVAAREYPLLEPRPGWQVQDPETVLAAVSSTLADCAAAIGTSDVVALSVNTAMHGLIGLDAAMRPLTPLVTWADARAREESRELQLDVRTSGDSTRTAVLDAIRRTVRAECDASGSPQEPEFALFDGFPLTDNVPAATSAAPDSASWSPARTSTVGDSPVQDHELPAHPAPLDLRQNGRCTDRSAPTTPTFTVTPSRADGLASRPGPRPAGAPGRSRAREAGREPVVPQAEEGDDGRARGPEQVRGRGQPAADRRPVRPEPARAGPAGRTPPGPTAGGRRRPTSCPDRPGT